MKGVVKCKSPGSASALSRWEYPHLLPSRLLSWDVTPAPGPHGIQEAREGAPPGVCEGSMLGPDSVGGWGQHPAGRSLIRIAQRGGWYGYP